MAVTSYRKPWLLLAPSVQNRRPDADYSSPTRKRRSWKVQDRNYTFAGDWSGHHYPWLSYTGDRSNCLIEPGVRLSEAVKCRCSCCESKTKTQCAFPARHGSSLA